MSTPTLKAQVDRGLELVATINKLEKELEEIEEAIREHARLNPEKHVPLAEADREGRQFIATGSSLAVPVIFTADKLVGTFQKGSAEHHRILAGLPEEQQGMFTKFYKPVTGFATAYKDGQDFRRKAAELLGAAAPAFVTACKSIDKHGLPKHDVKIEWKAAAAAAKLEEVAA